MNPSKGNRRKDSFGMQSYGYRRLIFTFCAAMTLCSSFVGCGKDSSVEPSCKEGASFYICDFVDLTRVEGLVLVDRNDSLLVISFSDSLPKMPTGSIIVGSDRGGYIGRVVSTQVIGSKLIVKILPAYATDVVGCGIAEASIKLSSGSWTESLEAFSFDRSGELVLRRAYSAPGVSLSSGGIELRNVVIYDGKARGGYLYAVIREGRISFEPALDLVIGLGPKKVSSMQAIMSGNYDLSFDALIETSDPCDVIAGVEIAAFEADCVIRTGDFPIVARVILKYNASIDLRGGFRGNCTFGSSASGELSFGASNGGGNWAVRAKDDLVFGVPSIALPNHSATRVTIGVWPSFEIEFYGTRSIYCSRHVGISYLEFDGGAPVLEWQKKGIVYGYFSYEPGKLDRNDPICNLSLLSTAKLIEEGPYKTDRYILVAKWGSAGTRDGEFGYPKAVAVDDDGFVYVVDNANDRIQRFSPDGVFVSSWGKSGSGTSELSSPEKISISSDGTVFVVDAGNRRMQSFTREGSFVATWGSEGSAPGSFLYPYGIATPEGSVFITDFLLHRIQRFAPDGTFLLGWGSHGSGDGQFDCPAGCAWSPVHGGRIVICDSRNDRIGIFLPSGVLERWFGSRGTENGSFDCPVDVAVDAEGRIFVCDLGNDRIQIFSPSGTFEGKIGSSGSDEGQFDHPEGLAVDSSGNIYVADARNHRIQKFAPRFR